MTPAGRAVPLVEFKHAAQAVADAEDAAARADDRASAADISVEEMRARIQQQAAQLEVGFWRLSREAGPSTHCPH